MYVLCIYKCFIFIHVFFQAFKTDLQKLPASLAGSLDLIPELLNVSRANATVKAYLLGFTVLKAWKNTCIKIKHL
jgi:hypothetical protein